MTRDVLDHDDGVVDNEAHRQRDAEHGEHVHRIAEQTHCDERAQDGNGDGRSGYQRRGCCSQESEDDYNNQDDRDQQGPIYLRNRIAYLVGFIANLFERDSGRQ